MNRDQPQPRCPRATRQPMAVLTLLLICCLGLTGCRSGRLSPASVLASAQPLPDAATSQADPGAAAQPEPEPVPQIWVHVTGAVTQPGVYSLDEGARAWEALAAAGGPAADGVADAVNLAVPLADGQQLWIPSRAQVTAASGSALASGSPSSPGGAPVTWSLAGVANWSQATGPTDVNRATAAALEALPGIGPVLARRIIAYRQANGPFAQVDDLIRVAGIGDKKLAELRPLVVARP